MRVAVKGKEKTGISISRRKLHQELRSVEKPSIKKGEKKSIN